MDKTMDDDLALIDVKIAPPALLLLVRGAIHRMWQV